MSKSSSSKRWLKEHFSDEYVKKAKQAGFRSRAIFKLKELQDKEKLFKPGMVVVDLGAAPGSWSELVAKLVGQHGRVIALDLLPIDPPIPGVDFIQGDFTEDGILDELMQRIAAVKIDWVISDMAPNLSGLDSVDQPRSIYLAELALDFALKVLKIDGSFLVKTFQGEGFDEYLKTLRGCFSSVTIKKPKASRDRSREVYLLARKLKNAKI